MKRLQKNTRLRIGFITDEIHYLNLDPTTPSFDSTWQLMEFGKKRHDIRYIAAASIQSESGKITGLCYEVTNLKAKEKIINGKREDLTGYDILIIRRDPPFNQEYLAMVQLLQMIENQVTIINRPGALATYNEKINAMIFPEYAPKSLTTNSIEEIKAFRSQQKNGIILKGLDNKGGSNIFILKPKDPNTNEIIFQMTRGGSAYVMCQEYLDIDKTGDKRVTVMNGKVMGGFLRRPKKDDFRGNINKGATATPAQPTAKEKLMAEKVGAYFLERGMPIIGIDLIGGKITEINVTSPLLSNKFMPEIESVFYEYIQQLCR